MTLRLCAATLLSALILAPLAACGGGDNGDGPLDVVVFDWGGRPDLGDPGTPDVSEPDIGTPDVQAKDVDPGLDTPDPVDTHTPGAFLEPCEENEDCISNWCVPSLNGKVCSKTCITDCGEPGWRCEQNAASLPDIVYICIQVMGELCRPCDQHDDCNSPLSDSENRCLDFGELGGFCGVECDEDRRTCPEGYACWEMDIDGETLQQCYPDSAQCECTSAFYGLATYCHRENAWGTCTGQLVCQEGGFSPCDAPEPADEDCNGVDDDCDGVTDEGLGSETCGLGICHHTIESCSGGDWRVCDPMEGALPESCNDIDDDCNGLTDDSWPEKYGPCDGPDADVCERGQFVCSDDGSGLVCEGDDLETLEDCNGEDDDCDGLTDEPEDLGTQTCGFGICAHEVSSCVDGQWEDCDPMEGAQDEDDPDDELLDTDCDGIDGDAGIAVFVDAYSGVDTNPGTRDEPVKTITQGLRLANPTNRPHVYVSVGTYDETLTLRAGVSVFGGYNAAESWARDPSNTVSITGGTKTVIGAQITTRTVLDTLTITAAGNTGYGASSYGIFLMNCPGLVIRNCVITAGDGGSGQPGGNGSNGSNGDSGDMGESGCEYGNCGLGVGCSSCSRPDGGDGGDNRCDDGSLISGGDGGSGGSEGGSGYTGSSGYGGDGGDGGSGGSTGNDGQYGGHGGDGGHGDDGDGGGPFGGVSEAGYVTGNGAQGDTGAHGSGGGGGGAGGGDECAWHPFGCETYGSGGGGGGAGGCGGAGGSPGQGGGGSFAIFLWGGTPAIENCVITTGRGGQGGSGGSGGSGGDGGGYGDGGAHGDGDSQGNGVRGGNGGDGGDGGHGGGGGGGPSVGIICGGGARPVLDNNDFVPGTPGSGGISPGRSGSVGHVANHYGCF